MTPVVGGRNGFVGSKMTEALVDPGKTNTESAIRDIDWLKGRKAKVRGCQNHE